MLVIMTFSVEIQLMIRVYTGADRDMRNNIIEISIAQQIIIREEYMVNIFY
jgi:hypothetical protein